MARCGIGNAGAGQEAACLAISSGQAFGEARHVCASSKALARVRNLLVPGVARGTSARKRLAIVPTASWFPAPRIADKSAAAAYSTASSNSLCCAQALARGHSAALLTRLMFADPPGIFTPSVAELVARRVPATPFGVLAPSVTSALTHPTRTV